MSPRTLDDVTYYVIHNNLNVNLLHYVASSILKRDENLILIVYYDLLIFLSVPTFSGHPV